MTSTDNQQEPNFFFFLGLVLIEYTISNPSRTKLWFVLNWDVMETFTGPSPYRSFLDVRAFVYRPALCIQTKRKAQSSSLYLQHV
jgi:hypothetical protein